VVGIEPALVELGTGPLEVACREFGVQSTRLMALKQGPLCIGIAVSDYCEFKQGRQILAEALGIPIERTLFAVTHNPGVAYEGFAAEFEQHASRLPSMFRPVEVSWGSVPQDQLTYNRKGRRKDGSAIYIWEEERGRLRSAVTGPIDPLASVVRFDDASGAPALLMAHFTGHSGHPADAESSGLVPGYTGWAAAQLARQFHPHYPVTAFLQGCAGDVDAKHRGRGAKRARGVGLALGKSFVEAATAGHYVERPVLAFARSNAVLRYAPLPAAEELQRDREAVLQFLSRLDSADDSARVVLGCNLPKSMPLERRRKVAMRLLNWCDWALSNPLMADRATLPVHVVALGSVAMVFMPGEPFVGIGLSIRERSPFELTLPVGYTNSLAPGYIGQARDLPDRDYMSGYFRQAGTAPFAKPWGDMLVFKALELLHEVKTSLDKQASNTRRTGA